MVGFEPVGDHDVGAIGDQLVKDAGIVVVDDHRRLPEMAADKGLVGRARVGDEPHPRLIDRGKVGEAVAVLAARQRPLAVDKGRNRKKGLLSARRRDGDAAHRDVEPVGEEVVEQIDPHGGHELDVDAEPFCEVVGHVDIGADIRAIRAQEAERRVIAGRPDPQHAGCLNAPQYGRTARNVGHQPSSASRFWANRP